MRNRFAKGYDEIKVELMDAKLDIAKLFWDSYKMTWVGLQDVEYDKNNEDIRKACFDIVNNLALPTPKEAVQLNFKIENISRVCLAQITRGRVGWWYNVESQMPQYLNHGVTIPRNLHESKYKDKVKKLVDDSIALYTELQAEGFPPQDLRYLCLHGQQTSMVASCNIIALSAFFVMRTENGLTDELNLVARKMKHSLKTAVSKAKEQGSIDELDYDLWQLILSKLDCLGANKEVCLIQDKVFGNTGRFKSGNDNVPSEDGTIKPEFDFKKSAWYLELKDNMPDELLLPGEKQMIAKWNK